MGHTKRILASTMAIATLAALACAPAANAATPLSLTVNAGDNQNTLKGRRLTAYRLADYVDGTYVSTDGKYKDLDGVAVHTPDALKSALDSIVLRAEAAVALHRGLAKKARRVTDDVSSTAHEADVLADHVRAAARANAAAKEAVADLTRRLDAVIRFTDDLLRGTIKKV